MQVAPGRDFALRLAGIAVGLLSLHSPRVGAFDPGGVSSARAPGWAREARWYSIYVPRFSNGEPANDPASSVPWNTPYIPSASLAPTGNSPRQDGSWNELLSRSYGGDLQGVAKRLAYLERLGVNALLLSPVFAGAADAPHSAVDLRHIDPAIGRIGEDALTANATAEPAKEPFTQGDRVFLELLNAAHKKGIHVVIPASFADSTDLPKSADARTAYILAATARWMDPDSDGNPADGIDGWMVRQTGDLGDAFWQSWREAVKRINPKAAILGSDRAASDFAKTDVLDLVISTNFTQGVVEALASASDTPADGKSDSLRALADTIQRAAPASNNTTIPPAHLSGFDMDLGVRLMAALEANIENRPNAADQSSTEQASSSAAAQQAFPLLLALLHVLPEAFVTCYGDELGMTGAGPAALGPMPWPEEMDESAEPWYRPELFALYQLLNRLESRFAALRHGSTRIVLADDARSLVGVAREAAGETVIALFNLGGDAQEAKLPVGYPGRMVGVVTPQLTPERTGDRPAKLITTPEGLNIPRLRLGSNRQYADEWGDLSVTLAPRSFRLVVLGEMGGR